MIDLTQLTVGEALGSGSQGKVFLASDPQGVRFTVKLMVMAENANRQSIFGRAAEFREDLVDRSMVPILSYGMVSATPPALAGQLGKLSRDALVLVMPYIAGASLADLMADAPLTLRETAVVLLGIATALAKLPAGVRHGDLRAPNVFLRANGEVVLTDPDLTTRPPEHDDMRALGGVALVLLNAATPDGNALAITSLKALATDIGGYGSPMEVTEARDRLSVIAETLGAPREHPETVLLKRLKALETKPRPRAVQVVDASPAATWLEEHRATVRTLGVIGISALAAIGIAMGLRGRHAGAGAGVPLEPTSAEASNTSGSPGEPGSESGLYDHSGKVHYSGTVHVLKPNELLAQTDGFFEAEFEYPIERLALLSTRRQVLWEILHPDAGGRMLLDVKPDRYLVEEDRAVDDGGLQRDVRPVRIDFRNPLRLTTTSGIMMSPHPQDLDGGAEVTPLPGPPPALRAGEGK